MGNQAVFFRKADTYRVMIDADGIGHIRIIKRMNFRMVLTLFKELYLEVRKSSDNNPHIIIHVSPSLYGEMSENLKEFLLFCSACLNGTFELSVVE
jgi:hypothetical protein